MRKLIRPPRLLVVVTALMLLSAAFPPTLCAQSRVVTGIVKSDDGSLLPGVSIVEKGTTNGTVTDTDGKFSLSMSENSTLVASFIGMKSVELPVGNQTAFDITMESDVSTLNEVVVIDYGYGTVKKADMTGASATLSAKEISRVPVASAAQILTGRLPGVSVLTTDGSPDAEVVIRVRGGGSITQDNSPLYVVDGFIVPSIRDIPPTDIETMTVLKDASSTAIYGARAANGVILITTKKPVAGKTIVTYGGFMQFKSLPQDRRYEVLSPYEYVMANYEYAALRGDSDVEAFEKYFGKYDDYELYKSKKPTDWQDKLFGDPKVSQYHNLNIRGGTDKTKMMLSLTNNKDQGLMLNSGYRRNVINFKIDHEISKRLKLEATARITNTVVDGVGTAGSAQVNIKDAVQTRPINGIADDLDIDPSQASSDDQYSQFVQDLKGPVEIAKQDWRKRTTNAYVLSAALNWSIIDNLDFRSMLTGTRTYDENLRFYGPLTNESYNNGGNLPIGERTETYDLGYRWFNTLTYKVANLGPHELTVMAGQEVSSDGGKQNFLRAEDFRESITPEELFANMALGRADRQTATEDIDVNRLSVFGRADYQFNGKYLATFTMRTDMSSKFAKENRTAFFPALALAWRMSKEDFMQNATFVDDLKLRASYGETGNDAIKEDAALFLFAASTTRGPGWGNVDNAYYTPNSTVLYNPYVKWETTISRNIGLDFSFLKGALTGSLDVYQNTTKDLLLQSSIPTNTGFSTQWDNIGSTSNKGIELDLKAAIFEKGDLSISGNFNIGMNRAKIEELDQTTERFFQSGWASTDLNNVNDFYLKVGGRVGDVYGYQAAGYYTTDDFSGYDDVAKKYTLKEGVPNSSTVVGNTNIRPGFMKLVDRTGDGLITADDRTVIGNTLPKLQGGFGVNASWKNFDLSVFFNYSYGNDVYNTGKIQYNQYRRVTYGNMLNTMNMSNRFTYIDVDGTYTGTPGEVVTDLTQLAEMNAGKKMWSHASFGVAGAVISDWAVEDGSFIRLNNLSIGYSLPQDVISKVGMSRFRVYVTGNNLHIWTKYSGYDPEVSTSTSSSYQALTPGVDYSSFPRSRSYTIGVDISF